MNQQEQQLNGGAIVKSDAFGQTEIQQTGEVSASVMAEREKAMVQAMYIVALQRPRDMAKVEKKLLADCDRPGFAEVARYCKPVGKKKNEETGVWEEQYARGWSIRFAEAAMLHLGNLLLDDRVVSEDDNHIGYRYLVCDLESNVAKFGERRFSKTVERSSLKKGQSPIAERTNSKGEKTYIVRATEDELLNKTGSARSKYHRNVVGFIPGDILDACLVRIYATLDKMMSPEHVENMLKGFAHYGVQRADLEMYLGHDVFKLSSKENIELKEIFGAIKTKEATWQDFVESRQPKGSAEEAQRVGEEKLKAMQEKQAADATQQSHEKPKPEPSDADESVAEQPTPSKPKFGFGGKK